jgi:hypothetical protein
MKEDIMSEYKKIDKFYFDEDEIDFEFEDSDFIEYEKQLIVRYLKSLKERSFKGLLYDRKEDFVLANTSGTLSDGTIAFIVNNHQNLSMS